MYSSRAGKHQCAMSSEERKEKSIVVRNLFFVFCLFAVGFNTPPFRAGRFIDVYCPVTRAPDTNFVGTGWTCCVSNSLAYTALIYL